MTIENKNLSYGCVINTLKKVNELFTPPLSESVDIEQFADKLSKRADFAICYLQGKPSGFTAYYLNSAARQIYITLICVDRDFQSHGIGGKLIGHLKNIASVKGYTSIALEVNKANIKAYHFYKKLGFKEREDRGEKFLMIKEL